MYEPSEHSKIQKLDLNNELHNMAARGGAVGGLVLGILALISSLVTYYAIINASLAILLSVYGLKSRSRRLAVVGIVLGFVAILLSLMEINETLGNYLIEEQEF